MEISKTKQLAFVRRFYFIFPKTLRETIRKQAWIFAAKHLRD